MRRLLPALLALTMVTACGDDEGGGREEKSADRAPASSTATTTEDQRAPVGDADQRAVRKLAKEYYAAYADADWQGVCKTLSPRARARLKRKGGSCAEVFRSTSTKKARQAVRGAIANTVEVDGDRATAALQADGVPLPEKLYAAKIEGRWRIVIKRAASGAP